MPVNFVVAMAVVAFVSGIILIFVLKAISVRFGFLMIKGIPGIGGLAISLSFLLAAGFGLTPLGKVDPLWMNLFILAAVVVLFGLIDDLKNLSIGIKFFFQFLLAILLVGLGVRMHIMYLNNVLNICVTILWLLWIFNAFNLLDVMDALAAGTALIVAMGFCIVSHQSYALIAVLSAAFAASILSFFIFNLPSAKIYMGNSGSYFLGFVFGVISLLISYAPQERSTALATPLLILGFPILDTVFLVLMRLWRKKVPFQKSGDHLCLRFLALGYSKKKVLVLLLGLCLFFVAGGVTLSRVSMSKGLGVLAVVFVLSLIIVNRAARVKVYD